MMMTTKTIKTADRFSTLPTCPPQYEVALAAPRGSASGDPALRVGTRLNGVTHWPPPQLGADHSVHSLPSFGIRTLDVELGAVPLPAHTWAASGTGGLVAEPVGVKSKLSFWGSDRGRQS